VLAVGRERVHDLRAAARAERHAFDVAVLPACRRREIGVEDLRDRLADGEMSRRARELEVLLDERRRRAQRGRDVREAVDLDLRGEILRRIDVDAEKISYGLRELGPIEPLRRDVTDLAVLSALVDRPLEPRDQRIDILLRRLAGARRGHQPAAELRDRRLEDLGVLRDRIRGQALEAQIAREVERIMTIEAIRLEQRPAFLVSGAVDPPYEYRCDGSDTCGREPSPGSSQYAHHSSTR